MALNPDSNWYSLVVTTQLPVRSPPLLIQRSFTKNTYSIYLTDLTYIWGETLSRREIVQRALNEDTPIDPSEDASQMRILLEKLKEAVSLRGEGDDNDNIEIDIQAVPSKSSISTSTVMQLKVTYGLPEPLEPLLWTFKLQPAPQTQLTKRLILPLISLTSLYSTEVQMLVRLIKDKDIVLEKMQDSLEESKVSVANILGGGASRKRGLDKFDEKQWRSQILESKVEHSSRPERIVKSFFGVEDRRGSSASGEAFGLEWEEVVGRIEGTVNNIQDEKCWWDEIEGAPSSRQRIQKSKGFESDETESDSSVRKLSSKRDGPRTRETSSQKSSRIDVGKAEAKAKKRPSSHSDDEDEFEIQKTPPPRCKSASKVKSPSPSSPALPRKARLSRKAKSPERVVEDSTTEEDDDLDISPPKSPIRTKRAKSPSATARSPPSYQVTKSSTPPSSLPPTRELSFPTESSTALRKPPKSLSGSLTPTPSSAPPPHACTETKIGGIGGRIGMIGGKKASRESPRPHSPSREMPGEIDRNKEKFSDSEQKIPAKASAPLGKIGGKIGGKINGVIGGKKPTGGDEGDAKSEVTRKVDLPTCGGTPQSSRDNRVADVKREVPPKRELSYDPMDEGAADRKRRQLQQELEAKQKAPAKKKRKF